MNLAPLVGRIRQLGDAGARGAARRAIPPSGLTREHVRWAYRLFLDREAESDEVIDAKLKAWRTTRDLRFEFLASREFRGRNADVGLVTERTVVIKELEDGTRLFVDLSDYVIGQAIVRGDYESSELSFARSTISPGDTVLDLGANIGRFTVAMASAVGPAGRVYSFEPWAQNADLLERSIAENGFGPWVVLHRAAVGERSGAARLVVLDNAVNSGGAYLDTAGAGAPSPIHGLDDVRIVALDDLEIARPISFVKIDVEGAEPLALRGGARLLREDRPTILSEIHTEQLAKVSRCSARQFIGEMRGLGYTCHLFESGAPGRPIDDVADGAIVSVVFVSDGASGR